MSDQTMIEDISKSISKAPDNINWDLAKDPMNEEYCKTAFYIVEPVFRNKEDEEIFINMLEDDGDNWINIIGQSTGYDEKWLAVANAVIKNGY
jgi:hypothetical protein